MLEDTEAGCIPLDNEDIRDGLQELQRSVVAVILAYKNLYIEVLKNAMSKTWRSGPLKLRKLC